MGNISYYFLFLIVVGVLHVNASQEAAQLRKSIQSRRASRRSDGPLVYDSLAESGIISGLLKDNPSPQQTLKEADKITALPGQPEGVKFDQYAGYVTVDESRGRALFYYFVESPYAASTKPLVLWLNGGPGCSSLGNGAMQELGPFRVNSDGKTLSRNRHAWNNVANVIFLESPAGVGFSYSNTTDDYDLSGDLKTARDAYVFLINWLERFPEYKTRPFFIAGESYGGHYVPQLASYILHVNKDYNATVINLGGVFIGNPFLDDVMNDKGMYEFLWSHGVISDEMWANITQLCKFSSSEDGYSNSCIATLNLVDTGSIDVYDIYAPICVEGPNGTLYSSSYLYGYDPCIDYYIAAYLNDLEVQKSLHARNGTAWFNCVNLNWNDAPSSMVSDLSYLVENGLRVWIYSGDMDDRCPLTATRYTVKDLGLPVTKPWRPWYGANGPEVGGFVQQYKGGFTLASVRGSGHMVPSFQPETALVLFYSFLKGKLPPYHKADD